MPENLGHFLPLISGVQVTDLFGRYTYGARMSADAGRDGQRLLLLYGDNGCGKTTILNLMFHLLSPESASGHRSFLANTKFRSFKVTFSSGDFIEARRKEKNVDLIGPYEIHALVGASAKSVNVGARSDGTKYSVKEKDLDETRLRDLLQSLPGGGLTVFLLSDNRDFFSDAYSATHGERWDRIKVGQFDTLVYADGTVRERHRAALPSAVAQSVARAEQWLKSKVIQANKVTEASVSDLYKDIIDRLVDPLPGRNDPIERRRRSLTERISSLANYLRTMSQFGLTSEIAASELISAVERAPESSFILVEKVLETYLDTLDSRVRSLSVLSRRLEIFYDIVDRFFRHKYISINSITGIEVFLQGGEEIGPDSLSSGERHLLLMICNVLLGTSERSLFLIDEPELSLNVKWQRELVTALLDLSFGSDVQFVMATHSMEILTGHKESILVLKNERN